jgi:hypothetical protein
VHAGHAVATIALKVRFLKLVIHNGHEVTLVGTVLKRGVRASFAGPGPMCRRATGWATAPGVLAPVVTVASGVGCPTTLAPSGPSWTEQMAGPYSA